MGMPISHRMMDRITRTSVASPGRKNEPSALPIPKAVKRRRRPPRGEHVGAAAEMGGTEHDGGGVEDDHDHQPAKQLERHGLDDEGGDQDGGDSADREAEDDAEVDLADLDMADAGGRAAKRRAPPP